MPQFITKYGIFILILLILILFFSFSFYKNYSIFGQMLLCCITNTLKLHLVQKKNKTKQSKKRSIQKISMQPPSTKNNQNQLCYTTHKHFARLILRAPKYYPSLKTKSGQIFIKNLKQKKNIAKIKKMDKM